MRQVTDEDLMAYVAGLLTEERSTEIERLSKGDPEMAAAIELLSGVAGVPLAERISLSVPTVETRSAVKTLRRAVAAGISRHPKLAAAVLVIATVTAVLGGATWAHFFPPPLLADNFSDNWLNPAHWRRDVRPVVLPEGGHIRLQNRGYLVTAEEYPGPISVSLDWKWLNLAGHPHYTDDLTIALHTSGIAQTERSWEVTDGMYVRFESAPGLITVSVAQDGPRPVLGSTAPRMYPLPADEWHNIRLTDDGRTISVYLSGTAYYETPASSHTSQRDSMKPILEVPYSERFNAHHIAIYNREHLAAVPHESHIDNVQIRPLR